MIRYLITKENGDILDIGLGEQDTLSISLYTVERLYPGEMNPGPAELRLHVTRPNTERLSSSIVLASGTDTAMHALLRALGGRTYHHDGAPRPHTIVELDIGKCIEG